MRAFIALLLVAVCVSTDPDKCCVPQQWEADVISNGASYDLPKDHYRQRKRFGHLVYDAAGKRSSIVIDGDAAMKINKTRYIQDYATGYTYSVDLEANTCQRNEMVIPMLTCISDDATFHGTSYFGMASHPTAVNSWTFTSYNATYSAFTTVEHCYPVALTIRVELADNTFVTERTYANIKDGISDPSVFDVPDFCNPTPPRCCFADQWTAKIVENGDIYNSANNVDTQLHDTGFMYVDSTLKMIVRDIIDDRDANRTHVKFLQDYNTNIQYRVTDGVCQSFHLPTKFLSCIPDDANFTNTANLGDRRNPFVVDTWDFFDANIPVTMTVTRDGCVPVTQVIQAQFGSNNFEDVLWFENFQPWVNDSSTIFQLPTMCQAINFGS